MQSFPQQSDAPDPVAAQAAADALVAIRALSAQARLLRIVLRYGVKTRMHASPDIVRIRRNVEAIARIAPDQPFGVSREHVTIAGLPAEIHAPRGPAPDRRIVYLHGGGFVSGSPRTHRGIAGRLARGVRALTVVPDYRLAPEHPFPCAVEDAAAVYLELVGQGADPRRIAIAGDSAGGNLVFATLLKLKALGAPLPAAAVGMSPFVDFSGSGESFLVNALLDPMLDTRGLPSLVDAYAPGVDMREPLLSPLFGELSGLPPTLIQCGSDEILRDDAVRLHAAMKAARVDCTLEIWPRMPHVWQAFASFLPEARRAMGRISAFLRTRLEAADAAAI